MPIYEFFCRHCHHEFEQLTGSSEREKTWTCPACGSRKTSRTWSVFSAGTGSSRPTSCADVCGGSAGATGACSTGACPMRGAGVS